MTGDNLARAEPVASLGSPSEAVAPIAATKLWCPVCEAPTPFRNKAIWERSRQARVGLHGEHLVCRRCDTTITTLYVEEDAANG